MINQPTLKPFFNLVFGFSLLLFTSTSVQAIETQIFNFTLTPTKPYVDTGINLLAGDTITVSQDGSSPIYVSGSTIPWISATGDPGCQADSHYTLPGVNCWSLVGRIGTNAPFYIGRSLEQTTTHRGKLYLGINHQLPFTGSGSWRIKVIRNFTPPPPPMAPFLDLPWDYLGQSKSFPDAALSINSYFDHEYPLLSTGLTEPDEFTSNLTNYQNKNGDFEYSSHDGYDYGRDAGTSINTPLLAAASGCASYYYCSACGHTIRIDHGNGYQTRYYHLQPDGLVATSSACIQVNQGQPIGLVGATGNVRPQGNAGAHLHFMLIEDKNRDGNFDDNIPDGITDPFGWQSLEDDPWPNYEFTYKDQVRHGNDSHYLWVNSIPKLEQQITPSNDVFFDFFNFRLEFPAGTVIEPVEIQTELNPGMIKLSPLKTIGNTIQVTAKNLFGTLTSQLQKPFQLIFNFSPYDLNAYKPETLSIYSSLNGIDWQLEDTSIDWSNDTGIAQIDHLSYFSLAGELKDALPPTTEASISATPIKPNLYNIPINLSLVATDNIDGVGVDYTLYQINDGDWQNYTQPITFSNDDTYTLNYYSLDKNQNTESVKAQQFTIDTTITIADPELVLQFNPQTLKVDLTASPSGTVQVTNLPHSQQKITTNSTNDKNLEALITVLNTRKTAFYRFHKLVYNHTSSYSLPLSTFTNNWTTDQKGNLKTLTQAYYQSGSGLVTLSYSAKKDQTIITQLNLGHISRQQFNGLKIVKLYTNQGRLEYSY